MKFKNIQIKGIGRLPGNMIENGYCDELINLRHKDGVLRPIGNKQVTGYNNPSGTWSYMWIHQMDTVTNLIGYNSYYELCKIETSGSSSVIKAYTSTQSDLRVVTMKRFLIVLATNTYDVFHWDGTAYNLVTIPQEPDIRFTFATPEPNTDIAFHSTAEAVLGAYFDSVNTRDGNNFIRGSVMLRQAYKLYDGSYIFHTIPRLMTVMTDPVYDYVIDKNSATYRIITRFAKISRYIPDRTIYANLDPNIVQSVCIFASKVQDHFQIDEETITDSLLTGLSADTFLRDASVPKNPDYLTLSDAPAWYKVHEIDISAIQNLSAAYSEEIDMRGFYQDYGTRETLPVDNFSRQMITGYADFNYNSRLLIGKITTIFADPSILQSYYPPDGTYDTSPATKTDIPGYFRTTLKTDDGEKYVYTPATFTVYHISSYYIFFSGWGEQQYIRNRKYTMGCIGYPDARASKIEVLLFVSGINYYKFGEFKLTKSKYDNYAYFNNTEFASLVLNNNYISGAMSEESIDTGTFTALKTFQDFNRVQASELSNPLVFPAENSYQVGTGSIIAICAASEPLSTGQFGEYPVHIFTTKGIYALNQGSGDVLFSTVTPASPEVANNRDNVISLGSGVVFTTVDGIYVIQGRQVKDIGKIMYGIPDTQLKDNANLHRFLNGGNLPFFPDTKLSDINFQDYLSGSVIGYDKQNNELVISNDDKQYSYVYNFDSGFWSKFDISYSVLINNYPELWGYTIMTAKIMNISVEYWDYIGTTTPAPVPIMFLTRPIKIDADGIFSMIHRTWLRCFVNTPSYLLTGIYVFGSNDMITWQFLTGMQREGQIHDMRLTRIHSKVKYFSVMFTAAMDRNSHIGNIELQYYNKLTNKIR